MLEQPMNRLYLMGQARQRRRAMAELSRLPQPIAEVWEWQYEGACRDKEPEMFSEDDRLAILSRRGIPVISHAS